ncbi:MAG TPA: hypothetical protein VIJ64_06690 [Candidatus Lustribacter sp.]
MMRLAALLTVLAAVATAAPAAAAHTPSPHPTGTHRPHATGTHKPHAMGTHKPHVSSLENPANHKTNPHTMSGRDCISGPNANRAQQAVNPITGKPQAAPFVSIPLTKGGGSVASATTRAQQAQACAHTR